MDLGLGFGREKDFMQDAGMELAREAQAGVIRWKSVFTVSEF